MNKLNILHLSGFGQKYLSKQKQLVGAVEDKLTDRFLKTAPDGLSLNGIK